MWGRQEGNVYCFKHLGESYINKGEENWYLTSKITTNWWPYNRVIFCGSVIATDSGQTSHVCTINFGMKEQFISS